MYKQSWPTLHRIGSLVLVGILLVVATLSSFGVSQASASEVATVEDLSGKKVGMYSNTEPILTIDYSGWDISYIDDASTLEASLLANKIDAFVMDRGESNAIVAESDGNVQIADGTLGTVDTGFLFTASGKGAAFLPQFNTFLQQMKESGQLAELQEKWFGQGKVSYESLGYEQLDGSNGTLRCVAMTSRPYVIAENGSYSGYEPELLMEFCKAYGYKLVIDVVDWGGMLAGVESGRYDVGIGCIFLHTFASEDAVASDITYSCDLVALSRAESTGSDFFASVYKSFQKNLIEQDRWIGLVQGAGVTLLISVFATLLGVLLGFGLYMASRSGNRVVLAIARAYSWFVRGMPAVLLLMILYYVVFGSVQISGIIVSILAFGLMLGSGVYNMVRNGVDAIDPGQMQSALALGYTPNQAFFKFILPQAAAIFLPQLRSEVVSLVKGTAIVGYIAVVDLTKAGDLIRSNTFDAFFPLITCAIVYFVIIAIVTRLLDFMAKRLDTTQRTEDEILKGIQRTPSH